MAGPLRPVLMVIAIVVAVLLVVALVGGLVLCIVRRDLLGPTASKLAAGGLGVLIAGKLLGEAWNHGGFRLFTDGADDLVAVFTLYGLLNALIYAAGIGLLVAAVFAGRTAAPPPYQPPGYTPPPSRPGP